MMKMATSKTRFFLTICLSVVAVMLSSCKDETDEMLPSTGSFKMTVENYAGNTPLQIGQMNYTNAAGNTYQVDLLKYYISNIALIRADSSTFELGNYDLIDAELPDSRIITSGRIPNGNYVGVRFYVGVDSARNNSVDQSGDLDPSYGMFWPWNTGYIFFKHEGFYTDTAGNIQSLLFHYGTDVALATVQLPLQLEIKGNEKLLTLRFDLNALYSNPNIVDFNIDNYHQSDSGNDRNWIEALKQNFPQSFTVSVTR